MKLVTFVLKKDPTQTEIVGALTQDEQQIVELQKACKIQKGKPNKYFDNMIEFLAGAEEARALVTEFLEDAGADCKVSMEDVQLLAPVPRPRVMRDCACFEEHLIGCNRRGRIMQGENPASIDPESVKPDARWYAEPRFYKVNVNSIVGPGEDIAFPGGEMFKDYELELAFYICKEGKNISHHNAMDYVGGYTIFNDFSARMIQMNEMAPDSFNVGPGIGKDFANAMGPCMVTPDAFDYTDAKMTVRVNGEVCGGGNHGAAYHKIPDIIEYISNATTLYPGDVIATGTVGTGSGIETGIPLKIDDVVELEIEGIGKLANRIIVPEATKQRNKGEAFKRLVCGPVDGKSSFVIDDYPDKWRGGASKKPTVDVWRINEMPAKESATANVDMGNLPIEHEPQAGMGQSIFRHVPLDIPQGPRFENLPPNVRDLHRGMWVEVHKTIGTKYIPTEEDMKKHVSMHWTETINMFFCADAEPELVSLNDLDDAPLKTGDALVQMACMHGWTGTGVIGGILASADMNTHTQLIDKPKPVMVSKLNRFKRYVAANMKSSEKEIGMSDVVIDDYSPNESEIFDNEGKQIGYAGDIWRMLAPNADVSASADTIVGPMEPTPPKNGMTFRMVDLLPGCTFETDASFMSYYSVIIGQLEAVCDEGRATVPTTGDLVQLKNAILKLENTTDEIVRFAYYMIDTI